MNIESSSSSSSASSSSLSPSSSSSASSSSLSPSSSSSSSASSSSLSPSSSSSLSSPSSSSFDCAWYNPPKSPFTPLFFLFIPKGNEAINIYFWILKDIGWMQGNYNLGLVCGGLALSWSIIISFKALLYTKNYHEAYLTIGQSLWLIANYIWMYGELYNENYSNDDGQVIYKYYTVIAGNVLLSVFFLFLKPFNILPKPTGNSSAMYDTPNVLPLRMKLFFNTWREYENIHILFWCGKDLSWNKAIPGTYWLFAFLTLTVSIDFFVTTFFHPELIIDHAHYIAIFLWVLGNVVWAACELNHATNLPDDRQVLFPSISDTVAFNTGRWWSSWLLVSAFIPIIVLYMTWWKNCNCTCDRYKDEHMAVSDENRVTVIEEKRNEFIHGIEMQGQESL